MTPAILNLPEKLRMDIIKISISPDLQKMIRLVHQSGMILIKQSLDPLIWQVILCQQLLPVNIKHEMTQAASGVALKGQAAKGSNAFDRV